MSTKQAPSYDKYLDVELERYYHDPLENYRDEAMDQLGFDADESEIEQRAIELRNEAIEGHANDQEDYE